MTVPDDVVVALVALVGTIVTASAGLTVALVQQAAKLRTIAGDAAAARAQVANTHDTNLRDDLTDLADDVRELRTLVMTTQAHLWAAITGRHPSTGPIPTSSKETR